MSNSNRAERERERKTAANSKLTNGQTKHAVSRSCPLLFQLSVVPVAFAFAAAAAAVVVVAPWTQLIQWPQVRVPV